MTVEPNRTRRSRASIAVIERGHSVRRQWLVQWNSAWQAYSLVGGHKRGKESYRRCLIRELAEELDVKPCVDYTLVPVSERLVMFKAWSKRAGEPTCYEMTLFRVRLRPEAAHRVSANPANRWLTKEEVTSGSTSDGRPVSESVLRLLTSFEVLEAD